MSSAADVNIALMELLGYERYVAQGGDYGSAISGTMAMKRPDRMIALHLNFILGRPADPANPLAGLSDRRLPSRSGSATTTCTKAATRRSRAPSPSRSPMA